MEILKRKSGNRFREMLWKDGKSFKSPLFKRKTDAQTWKRNKLNELQQLALYGLDPQKGNMLFSDYSKLFLKKKENIGRSPSGYINHMQRLRMHILPIVGHLPLKNVRKSHGEELQSLLLSKGHNNQGVNLIVRTLKAVMLEAERDEYIMRTPFKNLKKLKESQPLDQFWTKEEINQFLRANLKDPNYNLFFMAIHTGMRKGELAGLKWSAISFQQRLIHVRATHDRYGHRESTKTGKQRSIPMNEDSVRKQHRLSA